MVKTTTTAAFLTHNAAVRKQCHRNILKNDVTGLEDRALQLDARAVGVLYYAVLD